jgi:hypothetical protein
VPRAERARDGVAEGDPSVRAIHARTLERRERPRIPLVEVLKRREDDARAPRRRAGELRAGEHVRLLPRVHDVRVGRQRRAERGVVREVGRSLQAHADGPHVGGFAVDALERDWPEVAGERRRRDRGHPPAPAARHRHLVRQPPVVGDDVGVAGGDEMALSRHAAPRSAPAAAAARATA